MTASDDDRGASDTSPRFALLVAALCALGGASAELLVLAVRRFALGSFVKTGAEAVWAIPLSWLAFVLPIGVVLAVLARCAPRLAPRLLQVFAPALVTAFGVLFLFYPVVHKVAVAVLALGVAVQLTRLLAPRPEGVRRWALRAIGAAAVAIPAAALAVHGGRALAEGSARSALPAPAAGAPNVLLLVLDTVRAESLGLFGHHRATSPSIDALAARGMSFSRAHSTAPWTLTSHASLFTGRYRHELSAGWETPLDDTHATLAEILAERGYATAGFVANVAFCSRETGLARGFAHYEDSLGYPAALLTASSPARIVFNNPAVRSAIGYHDTPGRRTAADVNASFLDWLDGVSGKPFFAFLNYYDAHEPYLPPAPWDERFGPNPEHDRSMIRQELDPCMAQRTAKQRMTPEQRRAEELAYDASIAWLDDEIGKLLAELDRRGVTDDTIIVLTSDHGELFGEHDLFTHGNCLYLPVLHVPLVISYPPRIAAGSGVEQAVSLRDVGATILDLVGAPTDLLPGTSLVAAPGADGSGWSPALSEVRPARNMITTYPAVRGRMRSLVEREAHLIANGDGVTELFDVLADPAEEHDLATDAAFATRLESLRDTVERLAPSVPGGD